MIYMAEQAIAQIAANMGGQEAAVAGSQAVVFTATDRKIIEERTGGIDKGRSFIDLMKNKPLTTKVENEESKTKDHQDVKELKGRFREHRRMIKHANLFTPREKVELGNEPPVQRVSASKIVPPDVPAPSQPPINPTATKPVAKEGAEEKAKAYDRMSAEQNSMSNVSHRVKELHLKRLLSESREQFLTATAEIRKATLRPIPEAGRDYIKGRLDQLTLVTAQYKLRLLKSLRSMDKNDRLDGYMEWLEKFIAGQTAA